MFSIEELTDFIVEAKSKTYAGDGAALPASRPGARDIGHQRGAWRYLDSYFGGTDFAGQEAVWHDGKPRWAMNYFGRITRPDLIDARRAGAVIKAALQTMYHDKRHFLGGMEYQHAYGCYIDSSRGGTNHFSGREVIFVDGEEAYELDYRGGLMVP
ncbi:MULTISPECIES: DUF5680 domain-containing protein [unclassified Sinorhizobium]|uniref:DUF5680 domain-containing protein n=1 Tax=unclassified Sinorhizobium TaxID=2613772 RepID=UPI0024C3EC8E|nr:MULTISPECIES: DUF5680 domain-containing protein [unclassified Sinorhizobium]MDK1376205.1 DUF5680 domain-containing protein [Sinorhizobium sp. 6-70]MDK1479921.1 DUF5680 domain-containing protein [Sinorhizobium sp. 6-117]